jgi:VCBS repeat-containing protein
VSNVATVTLTVTAVNDAPVAVNDSNPAYTIAEDSTSPTSLVIGAPGVMSNDSDVDNTIAQLTATLVVSMPVSQGTVTVGTNGSFTFTPASNFNGLTSFTYKVRDTALAESNIATATITVTATNDPPVAAPDLTYSTPEDVTLTVGALTGVLANDTDVDGDTLSAVVVTPMAANQGTVVLNNNGSFTYSPAADFFGTASFSYRATDGTALSNIVLVQITVSSVNDAPVAVNDGVSPAFTNYTMLEDAASPLVVSAANGLLANDFDRGGTPPGGDGPSAIQVNLASVTQPGHGSVQVTANGGFTYTPTLNFNGLDSFTYRVTDGSADSNTATATVSVTATNDLPNANPDSYLVTQGGTLNVSLPGILGNDNDIDGNTLTVNNAAGVTLTAGNPGTLTVNSNGSFTYATPNATFSGAVSFTYQASDGTGLSNTTTVTITVGNDNPPTAVNDGPTGFTTDEDIPLTVGPRGILNNDTDPDPNQTQSLIATNVGPLSNPAAGSLVVNPNGGLTFTPTLNFNGDVSFTYRASDGQLTSNLATVTIHVNPVNDVPVAVNDGTPPDPNYTVANNTSLVVGGTGVVANDTDPENDVLHPVLVAPPAHGALTLNNNGSFTYTPQALFTGIDTFTYRASDNQGLSNNIGTVTITVTGVNAAPQPTNDSYTVNEDITLLANGQGSNPFGVLQNDNDPDNGPQPLTAINYSALSNPSAGTLTGNSNGTFTFAPNTNFFGDVSFTYQAFDGGLATTATVTIHVTGVNDAPVAVNDIAYSTQEDTSLAVGSPGVKTNDSDPDGDTINAVLVAGPSHGTVTLNPDGSFIYTPAGNFNSNTPNGPDFFTYQVNDGKLNSNVATVSITVTAVNDAPLSTNDNYVGGASATEDIPFVKNAGQGVLANDSDIDGPTLTAVLVSQPPSNQGTVTLNSDGSFTFNPALNFNGDASFTYVASDTLTSSAVATVTIHVNPATDAPVAQNDGTATNPIVGLEDQVGGIVVNAPGVLANDSDADNEVLTAVLVAQAGHGNVNLGGDGRFTYTPQTNFNGLDSFTYQARDPGNLLSNVATVTINVQPVNDAPVAAADTRSAIAGQTLSVAAPGVLGNDSDVDGDSLSAILVTNVAVGTLNLQLDGSFTYFAPTGTNQDVSFTYHARDGVLNSSDVVVTIKVRATNPNAPVANNDSYPNVDVPVVTEDIPLVVSGANGVLKNDTDADGDTLSAVQFTQPLHGTLVASSNGGFTYTPNLNFFGLDSFTYKATDGPNFSGFATVTINVAGVNDPPNVNNDSFTGPEDVNITVAAPGILSNDNDPEGNAFTAVNFGPLSNLAAGTLTANANGSFTFVPASNFNGDVSFTYQANDGQSQNNLSSVATVTIHINSVNDAPVATNDPTTQPAGSYTVAEDGVLTVSAANGVLFNDTDVDAQTLSAVQFSQPGHGSLIASANGGFTYTPASNFNGTDSFTYRAFDGFLNSNLATVTITVTAVNDAPVAVNNFVSTGQGTTMTVTAPGILGNDSDVEGNSLTAQLVSGVGAGNGTLTFNGSGNGGFTYAPPSPTFTGQVSFTYRANDGQGANNLSNIATVTINVSGTTNVAPVAVNDGPITAQRNNALTVAAPGILANDTDANNDTLSAVQFTQPTNGGTLVASANGGFVYTPANNFVGLDSFTYKAFDGQLQSTNTGIVTINVQFQNNAPVAVPENYSATEDVSLTVGSNNDVLQNDFDIDGDQLTAVLVADGLHGHVDLQPDGTFTYSPSANFNGVDSFSYQASDGQNLSNVAVVTITVTALNDAPVAVDNTYGTAQNTVLRVSTADRGVLNNDTDVDQDILTATKTSDPVSGAVSNFQSDGTFTYTPANNFSGAVSFTYQANDGHGGTATATVTINVGQTNHAPVAVSDGTVTPYTVAEDNVLTVGAAQGVLVNDTDQDGDTLTAIQFTQPLHGSLVPNANGGFTYQPNGNYNGLDSFTYRAFDGQATSANLGTVTINVTPVNDAPVAIGDSYTGASGATEDVPFTVAVPGVLGNDTDADGDALTAALVSDTANGHVALGSDGRFTYTPNANFNGTDSFTYRATDSQNAQSGVATVTIGVAASPDAPVATNDSYSVAANPATLVVAARGVLNNDSDADGDTLTATKLTNPASGNVTMNSDGSFSYVPAAGFTGTVSFTYSASDPGNLSSTAVVTIKVGQPNNAPSASNDGGYSTLEDTALTVGAPGVLTNDSDPDGDSISAVQFTTPAHGTVVGNANGGFTYTPANNYSGLDSFTYKASDGQLTSNTATVTINVISVNDVPNAGNDTGFTTNEDTVLVSPTSVLVNDTDSDGPNPLVALLAGQAGHGTVVLDPSGIFTYTPNANYNNIQGLDSFTYRAFDGLGTSNVATVTISVAPVNDAPTALPNLYTTQQGTAVTVAAPGVLGNDSDIDGDAITAILSSPANTGNGTVVLNANGSFTYTPVASFIGTDSFTYHARDGQANSADVTVFIQVNQIGNGNVAPTALDDVYPATEDTPLTVNVGVGVLANDSDPNGDSLIAIQFTQPSHGTLVANANGSFTYTPDDDYNNLSGLDSFTYRAFDGQLQSNLATVTINVAAVNDAPVALNDTYNTSEDTAITIPGAAGPSVLNNDSDVDGNTLTAVQLSQPAHGTAALSADGSFIYTPSSGFSGVDIFTYRASDGQGGFSNAATITINVSGQNDPPQANADHYTITQPASLTVSSPGVLGNDVDTDGPQALSATIATQPGHSVNFSLNANGSFNYTPAANFSGVDSFTYNVSDGTDSRTATAFITVNVNGGPTNRAPVVTGDTFPAFEDTPLTISAPGVLGNDVDPDGDSIFAQLVTTVPAAAGTLSLSSNGGFVYTPASNFFGLTSFVYRANDGQLTSATNATVTINVQGQNDDPIGVGDQYSVANINPNTVFIVPGQNNLPKVLANDRDPDNDTLTATVGSLPTHGGLTLNPDGGFTYTPETGFLGLDSFTYRASDGNGGLSGEVTVVLNNTTNSPPTVLNDNIPLNTVFEDTAFTYSVQGPLGKGVLSNDQDNESNQLTATLVQGPGHAASFTLSADGTFTYTPAANYNDNNPNGSVDSFTYRANDGIDNSQVGTVTIHVTPVNDKPAFTIGVGPTVNDMTPQGGAQGQQTATIATGITAGPPDEAGQALTFNITGTTFTGTTYPANSSPFAVAPAISPNGTLTFTPAPNARGTATITVSLSDNGSNQAPNENTSTTQTFTINLNKPAPWYNVAKPFDADKDNHISVLDALAIINYLNSSQPKVVPPNAAVGSPFGFIDTDHDNNISPIDALLVINFLNAGLGGEGEGEGGGGEGEGADAFFSAMGSQPAAQTSSGPSESADSSIDGLVSALTADAEQAAKKKRPN